MAYRVRHDLAFIDGSCMDTTFSKAAGFTESSIQETVPVLTELHRLTPMGEGMASEKQTIRGVGPPARI